MSYVLPSNSRRGLPCASTKHKTSHSSNDRSSFNRHYSRTISTTWTNTFFIILSILICFSSTTSALEAPMPVQTALDLASFAHSGMLLVDQRPPPRRESIRDDLRRRDDDASATKTTTEISSTSSATASTTLATSTTSKTALSTTLPKAFDSSLGNNFTASSCPNFITDMIATEEFQECYPFSLLLQTSMSFFQAQKSSFLLTQTLDKSCSANVTTCSAYLNTVANNLTTEANCKADYELGNPTVMEARNGLLAYKTLYQATCLHNPETSSYCAVDAFTNTSSPTDSYIYYLPLGTQLPGGTTPTCDACLENTMEVFQKMSADRSLPISNTYASAAVQVNIICGPKFTNTSVPIAVSNGASKIGPGEGIGALLLAFAVAFWLF